MEEVIYRTLYEIEKTHWRCVAVDELTDRTDGSADAVVGAAIDPYRKCRLRPSQTPRDADDEHYALLIIASPFGYYWSEIE